MPRYTVSFTGGVDRSFHAPDSFMDGMKESLTKPGAFVVLDGDGGTALLIVLARVVCVEKHAEAELPSAPLSDPSSQGEPGA